MKLSLYTFADEAFVPGSCRPKSIRYGGMVSRVEFLLAVPSRFQSHSGPPEGIEFHALGLNGYWPGNRKAELPLN